MKKFVPLWLALALAFLCSACLAMPESSGSSSAGAEQPVSASSNVGGESAASEESTASEPLPEWEAVTAVDNEACVIQITELEPDGLFGYTLKALLENKSADTTYMFAVETASINGVQCDPFFAAEVAGGKKSNEKISFSVETLQENGITEFTDIELTFRVHDSNDWTADDVAHETVHIYPQGPEKATAFVRQAQPGDQVLVDNEYVTVIVTGATTDSIWGPTVNLFLVNKTETEAMFSVDNASVNGFMVDPFYADSVSGGKCCFSTMSWSDSSLEENGIESIETIEFTLRAHNNEDWMEDDYVNEPVTLTPVF